MTDDLIKPGELVELADAEVSQLAVIAAKAELSLEATEAKTDVRKRSVRTLLQGAAVVAVLAMFTTVSAALSSGDTDYRTIAMAAGQAGLTALMTYLHNRLKPAS